MGRKNTSWVHWGIVSPTTSLLCHHGHPVDQAYQYSHSPLPSRPEIPTHPLKEGPSQRGQRSQDTRNRRGCSRMCKDKLPLLSLERETPQPASNLHRRIVVLLCKGVRRGVGEVVPREGASRRGEKSSIFRPAHTAGLAAVCNASSHSH